MPILVKCRPGDTPIEITTVQLEALIREGRVRADSLIHEKILTDGKWRTADNLYLFHRAAPDKHPYGPHLLEQEKREERRRIQGQEAESVYAAYRTGSLIEESFGLEPIERCLASNRNMAVSRLIVMPSFKPERIVTVAFSPSTVEVRLSQSPTAAWDLVPQHGGRTNPDGTLPELPREPFFKERVVHTSLRGPFASALEILGDLPRFLQLGGSPQAKKDWATLDGVGFRHRVASPEVSADVRWSNPVKGLDAGPLEVIALYRKLVGRFGFPDFVIDYEGCDPPPQLDLSKLKR